MTPKEYRNRIGITQLEAANDFQVTPTTWWRWENAKKFPDTILQLAELKFAKQLAKDK